MTSTTRALGLSILIFLGPGTFSKVAANPCENSFLRLQSRSIQDSLLIQIPIESGTSIQYQMAALMWAYAPLGTSFGSILQLLPPNSLPRPNVSRRSPYLVDTSTERHTENQTAPAHESWFRFVKSYDLVSQVSAWGILKRHFYGMRNEADKSSLLLHVSDHGSSTNGMMAIAKMRTKAQNGEFQPSPNAIDETWILIVGLRHGRDSHDNSHDNAHKNDLMTRFQILQAAVGENGQVRLIEQLREANEDFFRSLKDVIFLTTPTSRALKAQPNE